MSPKDSNQPLDSQPTPTPTPRFAGLRHVFRAFSTPDTKPSAVPSDTNTEPPRSESPVDNENAQTNEGDDAETIASPTPLQRFWRHARTRTTDHEEFPPPRWLAPEASITTEHASPAPALSRSPSSAANELEAVSPMPTNLITPPEGTSDPTQTGEGDYPSPMSLAQRIHSIIASTPTAMYQPMVIESPTTPNDRRTLPQSPVPGPSNLLSPMADSRFLSFLYSPKLMNSPGSGQGSVFSMLEKLQSPMTRGGELPAESGSDGDDGQGGYGTEVAEDGSSLMLCSPLIPQRDSLVEIAETEYVSFNEAGQMIAEAHRSPLHRVHTVDDVDEGSEPLDDVDGSETFHTSADDDKGEGTSHTAEGSSAENGDVDEEGQPRPPGTESRSIFRWPWSKTEEERCAEQKAKEADAKAKEERRLKKKHEKLVWVPSPTKISLQTMWWGYRMSVNSFPAGSAAN